MACCYSASMRPIVNLGHVNFALQCAWQVPRRSVQWSLRLGAKNRVGGQIDRSGKNSLQFGGGGWGGGLDMFY